MTQPLSPTVTDNIGEHLGSGHTERNTADILGISRGSVSRYRKDPKIKAKIEAAQAKLAGSAMDIVKTDLAIIKHTKDILDRTALNIENKVEMLHARDMGLLDLYTKVSKRVGQAIGIFNTPAPSLFIQNMYQDNRQQTIAPGVLSLISGALAIPEDTSDQDIIEGEYSIIE